jgi:hypothetical protein
MIEAGGEVHGLECARFCVPPPPFFMKPIIFRHPLVTREIAVLLVLLTGDRGHASAFKQDVDLQGRAPIWKDVGHGSWTVYKRYTRPTSCFQTALKDIILNLLHSVSRKFQILLEDICKNTLLVEVNDYTMKRPDFLETF